MTDRDCELDRPGPLHHVDRLIERAVMLKWGLAREHADHAYSSRNLEPTSGGGPSDPTAAKAAANNPAVKQVVRHVKTAITRIDKALDELERPPFVPDRLCVNCGWKTATHPKSDPKRDEACDRFLRRNGYERPEDLWQDEKEREYARTVDRRRHAS